MRAAYGATRRVEVERFSPSDQRQRRRACGLSTRPEPAFCTRGRGAAFAAAPTHVDFDRRAGRPLTIAPVPMIARGRARCTPTWSSESLRTYHLASDVRASEITECLDVHYFAVLIGRRRHHRERHIWLSGGDCRPPGAPALFGDRMPGRLPGPFHNMKTALAMACLLKDHVQDGHFDHLLLPRRLQLSRRWASPLAGLERIFPRHAELAHFRHRPGPVIEKKIHGGAPARPGLTTMQVRHYCRSAVSTVIAGVR